ncbi:hypothetical protein Tco_1559823 [Tanacetum coccineum]
MLWHQNSGAKPLPLNSGAKLHFAGVAPLLEFGTKSLAPRLPMLSGLRNQTRLILKSRIIWILSHKRAEAATRRGKKEEKRHEIEMKKQLKNQQEETEKKEKE